MAIHDVKQQGASLLQLRAEAAFVRMSNAKVPLRGYLDANEVPVAHRVDLITLTRSGMPLNELATRFGMSIEVVMVFALGQIGDTEH